MQIQDYISEAGIVFTHSVSSKKAALEILSDTLAHQDNSLSKSKILDALLAREKLGSTGLGKGIAIPHCRLQDLGNIYVTILKLEEGVEYDANDDEPVFFLFCLVVPDDENDEHLELLASLAELLDNEQIQTSIRESNDAHELYQALTQDPKILAA